MLGVDGDLAVSPNVIKRRRGGLIEQRDIVKAHQAHKIHSTPQARRKEWDWGFTCSGVGTPCAHPPPSSPQVQDATSHAELCL
ncbi:voltage-dependent R-type calcium channel subunit alpha-1E [Lates japonicus]|uniref:Voltage-dependent R-type calcium channel subunit alpha-1E n=1 Tax=Lates japonicus TaxID=270547 RepID=A0AAD3ND22_LATJO|nr:voltage-dependent R-type calcium channel subunit alpha-1E [Lates japonicus]